MGIGLQVWLATSAWAQSGPWWDAAWSDRVRLDLDNTTRTEALVDFPVLVVLEDGRNFDHSRALSGGDDLRFIDDDGVTELSYEIEQWDAAGTSRVWVRVPTIDAGTTDHIVLYVGNAAAPAGEDRTGTWSAEWAGVYHLDGGGFDSTAHSRHGADNNTGNTTGIIGNGRDFDGDDDQLEIPHDSGLNLVGGLTVSMWVHVDAWVHGDWDALLTKGDDSWRVHRCGAGNVIAFSTNGLSVWDQCGVLPLDDGAWHYVTAVWDPLTQDKRIVVDGIVDAQASGVTGTMWSNGDPVWIGNNADNTGRSLDGQLDEVRIASVPRSADWVDADLASVTDALVSYVPDADADGWFADLDCMDDDPAVNPAALEIPGNGIDDDCVGGDQLLDTGTPGGPDTGTGTDGASTGGDTGTEAVPAMDTAVPTTRDTGTDTTPDPGATDGTTPPEGGARGAARPATSSPAAGCGCTHQSPVSWFGSWLVRRR